MREKKLLLQHLTEGNSLLFMMASNIVLRHRDANSGDE